ncbi:MAG: hypothetical protein V4584_18540 [Verrucomicrobiota bacterium]
MERVRDERVKQVAIGAGILITLTIVVPGLLLGWRYMPGLLGEWVGTMLGILTTPFFMEATFATLGLVTVISLNHWRIKKDGDEFVYLDQISGPELPQNLPDHAKWAIYRQQPLDAENPSLLAQAEGAFAIGDYTAATQWIGEMSAEELRQPATLRLRHDLATATGRTDLVGPLEQEIKRAGSFTDVNL